MGGGGMTPFQNIFTVFDISHHHIYHLIEVIYFVKGLRGLLIHQIYQNYLHFKGEDRVNFHTRSTNTMKNMIHLRSMMFWKKC